VIDADGFRSNVGMIITNGNGDVLWGKRLQKENSWQFPQGGIDKGESPQEALYRELYEEVGLKSGQVRLLAETKSWLRYRIPDHLVRKRQKPRCIGQKQKWFLLELDCPDDQIRFDCGEKPEFSAWRWVSYWYPLNQVIEFKREVYRKAMRELSSHQPKKPQNAA